MSELTQQEREERAIAMLMRANSALSRVFNTEEGDICDECGEIHEEDFNE
jgi:hypothetical protein